MTREAPDSQPPKPSLLEQVSAMDWEKAYDTLLYFLTYETGAIGLGDLKNDPKELGKSIGNQMWTWPNVGIGARDRKMVIKAIDVVLVKLENEVLDTKIETEAQRSAAHKAVWLGAIRRGITSYLAAWRKTD